MTTTPAPIRLVTTGSGGLLLLSACGGVFVGFQAAGQPLWGTLSFEAILLVTGLLAVLLGRGRFAPGFGMAAGVLGACAIGATVLGYVDALPNLARTWAASVLRPATALRVALGMALLTCAAADVLRRDLAQAKRFLMGLIVLAPVAVVGAAANFGKLAFLTNSAEGNAELLRVGSLFILGVIGIALVSAGGHLVITAFLNASEERTASKA